MQLYALEGMLDRLSRSSHADKLVLKGGALLAAFGARRPTRDIDLAAVDISNDLQRMRQLANDIIALPGDDGLHFDLAATTSRTIRDEELYGGVRVTIQATLATAAIRFNIDINVGDPLWPAPDEVEVPRLLGGPPIRVRGYRVELVLAEKIVTAIQRASANTRWRDFVDIESLAQRDVDEDVAVEAIRRVAAFRQVEVLPLREALDGYGVVGQQRWSAWRRKQGLAATTPRQFQDLIDALVNVVDPWLERAATRPD